MHVTIMRGISGSGKDWWIEQNLVLVLQLLQRDKWEQNLPVVISTDSYFMVDGQYRYDSTKLAEYHNLALREYIHHIQQSTPHIVVNNTNIRHSDIAPFYRIAEVYGYTVEIVWMLVDPNVCKQRNKHGVPPEIIDKMFRNIDPIPPWWNMRVVMN